MTSIDQVRRVAHDLAGFNLRQEETSPDDFFSRVCAAHQWATTRPGRWRLFTRGTLYGVRHSCEYDVNRGIGDKAFAVGAYLAGWHLHPDWLRPHILRFRRAKAEA